MPALPPHVFVHRGKQASALGLGLAALMALVIARAADAPAAENAAPAPPAASATATPSSAPASPTPEPAAPAASPAPSADSVSPESAAQSTLLAFLRETNPRRAEEILRDPPPRSDLAAQLRTLEENGRAEDLVNAYLRYILAYPPDSGEYLDLLARLTWILNQQEDDSGLLTVLFQQSARFPQDSRAVAQIRLVEAEYLLRVGLSQPALVLLNKLGADPKLDPNIRMLANGRAGFLLERMGQPDEAINAYLRTADFIGQSPQAGEAMLRAGLLMLQAGRTDEALQTFAKLQSIPPDVRRQSGVAPAIADFAELASKPDEARAYWKHQEQWLPQWQKLAPQLGVPELPPGNALPSLIEDYRRLGAEGTLALRQQDASRYYQVVNILLNSARWRPTDLADAANLLYQGAPLTPDQIDGILALEAALAENLPPVLPIVNMQLVQLRIGMLIDHNKLDEARETAAVALKQYGDDPNAGPALARLYGLAVLRSNTYPQNGEEAIRYLVKSLDEPVAHGQHRAVTLAILADLLSSLERDQEASQILERELSQPARAETGGARFQEAVRETLAQLQQRQVLLRKLVAGLDAWWKQYEVPWFAYASAPAQKSALADDAGAAAATARLFGLALDPKSSFAVRLGALNEAWNPFPSMPLTGAAAAEAARDFALREDLPPELRYIAWAKTMWHLLWTGQRGPAEKLLAAAPAGAAADLPAFTRWLEYLAVAPDAAAQQEFAEKLLARPELDRTSLTLAIRAMESIARAGQADAAEALYKKLSTAKLDASAAEQMGDLSPQMQPLIAQYRATQPAADTLRKAVLEAIPAAASAAVPERWRDSNSPLEPDLDMLTIEEARAGLLAVIRDRLAYGQHPLQAFRDLGQVLPHDPANDALRFKMFEIVQQNSRRDEDRFYAALFAGMVDFDDPGLAERGWRTLASSRAPEFPRTSEFLNYYQVVMDWRAGKPVNLAGSLGPLDAPALEPYKLRLALDYYVQRKNLDALRALLAGRPDEAWLDPVTLGGYVRALRLLGREAALTRAADAALAALAQSVVASWARPDSEEAGRVFDLARALDEPGAYPRAWVDYLLQNMRNDNARDLVRLADAHLQRDWPATLAAANSFLSRNPTYYDYYWPKARALIELGRRREAIEPLRKFVKFSANELEHPEAVDLLRKLESESAPAARPAAAAR